MRSSALALAVVTATIWLAWTAPRAAAAAAAPGTEFAVIVSDGVPTEGVTFDELRRVFLFRRTVWRPGQPVNLILPDRGLPARAFLLRFVYRMSDQDLRRFILERIFQAEIDFAPKVVGSDSEAVSFVKAGRSIIALVPAGFPGLSDVRVLRVDGKLPGDAGYPLVEK